MATTRIAVPTDAFVQIMPASDSAFATLQEGTRIYWKRADTQPAADDMAANTAGNLDTIFASPTQPTWATSRGVGETFAIVNDD